MAFGAVGGLGGCVSGTNVSQEYGRAVASAPQLKDRGNVGVQVQRGEELLRYLAQEFAVLREAIDPILKPEPPSPVGVNESAPTWVALAEQLRRHNDGLEVVIAVVRSTRERVDL